MNINDETHNNNYRIAFDAMRAYHTSEIEHKKDMITILNSILLIIVSVYAGIYYFILSYNSNLIILISEIAVICLSCIMLLLLIRSLKNKNIIKIKSDNNRYEKFRQECRLERDILGLTKNLSNIKGDFPLYWDQPKEQNKDREGTGYLNTINIINTYSKMISTIVIIVTIIGIGLTILKFFNILY